jgi:hypothetical protein
MDSYETLIHREYDNAKCHSVYASLLEKPKDPDLVVQALEESLPVLGRVLGTCFRSVKPSTIMYEEILERVPYALYVYLTSDTFYNKFYLREDSHLGYLWGLFRHEVLNALAAFRRSIPSRVPVYIGYPDYYSEFLPAAVEIGIFLEQLPSTVSRDAEQMIRFRESPDYEICLTALEAIVWGKPIPWFTLRSLAPDYLLPRVEFLVEHARVLVRKVVFQYRREFEELQLQLNEEVQVVKESIRSTVGHTELQETKFPVLNEMAEMEDEVYGFDELAN